ncbi:hypothetical protein ES703_118176 [subsurface metagenome]
MPNLKLGFLQKEDVKDIKPLIAKYDFNDYRHYGVFKRDLLNRYLFNQISDLLLKDKGSWIVVAKEGKEIVGLVSLVRLNWGKEVFDIEMAEIRHLITPKTCKDKREIINACLSFIFQICRNEGIEHLSHRVDTSHFLTIHCLETNGFKIMDTLLTYLFNKRRHRVPQIRDLCQVRPFEEQDLESLINMVRGAFPMSRFSLDPNIPNEKVDEFYIKWVKDCCKGLLADKVLVAERRGRAVGFLAYRVNWELARLSGFKICGKGLLAVSVQGRGTLPTLMKVSIQDGIPLYDFSEYDTQITNYKMIKVCQRFGFDFIRSKYTFHKWFGK